MSKQLKFKLKKTLKNAEFVHADLEYHEELFTEAKSFFKKEVSRLIEKLPPEDQKRLSAILEERTREAAARSVEVAAREDIPDMEEIRNETCTDVSLADSENENITADVSGAVDKSKKTELKKLFYKIAEITHPDKVLARELSKKERDPLEKIFKKALQAYEEDNWYILYSIALKLEIELSLHSEEQITWIEEDIQKTLASISHIGSTVSWLWYVSAEESKIFALRTYFMQIYGFLYPNL